MRIVELRQYTLHPGRRDDLIDLFEREFVESQEAEGMTLLGQFRDRDAPDRFVWLRGFPDMEARRRALEAFYGGPVWQAHREAANATMADSDDVLLLRPLDGQRPLTLPDRAPPRSRGDGPGAAVIGVHRLEGSAEALTECFQGEHAPRLAAAGLPPVAIFVTEGAANTFPRLPVREGERILVWLALAASAQAADDALARARRDPALEPLLAAALQILRLRPTARSRLRGGRRPGRRGWRRA